MNQLIVPISFKKIQFSKIYCLYGHMGEKSVERVFPWNLLPDQTKASFSRAAFNCVEKNVNLRQCFDFHSKNVLLRLAATAHKKNLERSRRIWRFLWLLFHPCFPSCLFPYLRNFDAFRKANDMEWEANDKTLWLFTFCSKMVTLWSGWRRKEAFNPQLELADLCGGKAYWKKKGTSRQEVNKHSLVHSRSELRNNSNCRGKYSAKWKLKWKRQ